MKLEPIVRVGHSAEDVLSGIRQGRLRFTRRIMDALLAARDQLGAMLSDLQAGGLREYTLEALLTELEQVQSVEGLHPTRREDLGTFSPGSTADPGGNVTHKPATVPPDAVVSAMQSMRVDVRKLDELINRSANLSSSATACCNWRRRSAVDGRRCKPLIPR